MTTGSWLVLVDLQRIFGEPQSAWFTPGFARAEAGAVRLRQLFPGRTALTRFVAPEQPDGAWVPYYRQWPFALDPANADLYDLVPAVPAGDAVLISRPTFGKWDADTRAALGDTRDIVLAGVSTDCCVLSTALAAADDGVRVRVVADACAGLSDTDHQRALDTMALYAPLIEIVTIEDILAERGLAR
ncbi:cysteine hydrolase family protein [Cryobacterium sp. W22_MBD10_FK3]|jgi:nicotinamidase-related amidase|uniref:cysteine hydrolase family protein n=1 Tax=Cryobacterium sp. W22_MBD10_FK3 TaxID=3240273 RepID=UPI003F91748A